MEHVSTETPANITDLSGQDISIIPGQNLDDRLRMVPGFSLFRRTSSIVANPTTQGVSLRGIGSTGASRTLVLFDGFPMNDPFGGWIYWTRFTPEDLERVEVSRGASTSVYGNLAMGGAINIFPVEPVRRHVSAGAEVGSENTYDLWAGYTEVFRNFAITAGGRGFTTDGYYVVPDSIRGAVDRQANARFVNNDIRLDGFSGPHRLYLWFNSVEEERGNGTYLTHNNTTVGTAALRYLYQGAHNAFSVSSFGTSGQLHATFSSVTNNRNTERLTDRQTVPEDGLGGAAIYSHAGSFYNINAGADFDRDHGFSTDHYSPTKVTVAGGTLLEHGEFVQTDLRAGPVRFYLGARDQSTSQGHQFFSPSAGLSAGKGHWRARGSAYRALRSPTLNELYRPFSTGNTVTLANSALQPETLLGAEVGIDFLTERGAIRVTGFRNDLNDLITNVTLSSTATQIVRQRQNAGDALSRGVEISANQSWRNWTGSAGYLYADSRYATGLYVPQVPRHQGSAQLSYARGRTVASAGLRAYSLQFDDDQNHFPLPGFVVVQAMVRERIGKGVFASLEVTNLLDRVFYTGKTPSPTIGDPRLIRGGVIWKLN